MPPAATTNTRATRRVGALPVVRTNSFTPAVRADAAVRLRGGVGQRGSGGDVPRANADQANPPQDALNEEELNAVHPNILLWKEKLGMSNRATPLAVSSLATQVEDLEFPDDVITAGMVVRTMEAHCQLERSKTLIDLLQGTPSTPGVVTDIASINTKLPTIVRSLKISDEVGERGAAWLRLTTTYAFLSEGTPAYSRDTQDVANAVMASARHDPDQLGENGKHLLQSTNKTGTSNVLKIINAKISSLRLEMRGKVNVSIEEAITLKELVESALDSVSDMKVTWRLVQRVAIWRRTGFKDGCKQGEKWNTEFWHQVDGRLSAWLDTVRRGKDGDEEAVREAEEHMNYIISEDEERYGTFDYPAIETRCEVQQRFERIYESGLEPNMNV
ncbi:unnamed protein product [Tilletia controversa]|nr:unnamed protein product [Tilletia controversa]